MSTQQMDTASIALPTRRTCPFDPAPELAVLREQRPLCRLRYPDGHIGWLVTSHALAKTVLTDTRFGMQFSRMPIGDPMRWSVAYDAWKKAGMSVDDIDLFEVNEAFAAVPTAWLKTTGADPERLNVNGGAIALGHPLGGSGTKLMTTLVNALKQRNKRYGLQTMCEGGGMANVTIVERL